MEDSKKGIPIDNCIAEALFLETIAFENILGRPISFSSSRTYSESSKTEEKAEEDENRYKDESAKHDAEQPSSSKEATKTSLPSDSADKMN